MKQGHKATTLQERIEIWERSRSGETDREISEAMRLSQETVRKWRRKGQRQGRTALASKLGRPKQGQLGSFSAELRSVLREKRQAHPGWGAETLVKELEVDIRFQGQKLPSRARIAAFLKDEGLTRRYQRQTELTQPPAETLQAAHDEWEMDAQGVHLVSGIGRVSVINIGDPYSHVRVVSQACPHKSKADTADYQLAIRRAALRYGLPKVITLDHDSALFDNSCSSPYPSRLHLWLIALDVAVRFIPLGRPTAHGFIERTHRIVDQQALVGQHFVDQTQLQLTLDRRLEFLNTRYPSRALNGLAPLIAQPQAAHSKRFYRPEWETNLFDLQRVYCYLAQQHWFRWVTPAGQFSLGAYRYGLGKAFGNQTIDITFDPNSLQFICLSADAQLTQRVQPKGLTQTSLAGELPTNQFSNYQYALPWTYCDCRQNLLVDELTSTTF